ncbi:chemotaxis protein CheA [Marinicellulosiphila megalodicopiae]|uniref:chemotaxis protein CheA n=1 Tax=Marinicellulosiphila megalodicopiae TaxID=2724896 RepID=UPI003BAEBB63
MSIDLSQFHQVFFEESFEGLDVMENGLLELDLEDIDSELINSVFRAAHSIKGGSGTFGFSSVADFTHVLETLLDEIRSEKRKMQKSYVDLFLLSVDCLRQLLQQLQAEETPDLDQAKELKLKFEAILENTETSATSNVEESTKDIKHNDLTQQEDCEDQAIHKAGYWEIIFNPHAEIVQTGNEPSRLLKQLSAMGEMTIQTKLDCVPDFFALDPELFFVQWVISLKTKEDQDAISEIFEWVADDSDIQITWIDETQNPDEHAQQTPQVSGSNTEIVNEIESIDTSKNIPELKTKTAKPKANVESQSIRVATDKVDSLINMVGELVITQSMLGQLGKEFTMDRLHRLQEGLVQLEHNTRELQESVMRIRMLPISFSFNRFPRLVRDLSQQLNKKIDLKLIGENTELDKTVMEKIGDPMVHMVRNSLDHGIETPQARKEKGKSETGTLTLSAYHQGGNIIIEINDDGSGLNTQRIKTKAIEKGLIKESDNLDDDQINDLIFQPGFSTADVISDVSGRGVGMDVVRRNIQELNGSVEVRSIPEVGSTFKIRLPLTLAILDGQLVRVGKEIYILPLVSIVESILIEDEFVNNVGGGFDVLRLRDEYIPIIKLYDVFNIEPESKTLTDGLLVVVEGENRKVGFIVDELMEQQQVVIKSLEANFQKVNGVSGATILGDGTVAMILDVPGLIQLAGVSKIINLKPDSNAA